MSARHRKAAAALASMSKQEREQIKAAAAAALHSGSGNAAVADTLRILSHTVLLPCSAAAHEREQERKQQHERKQQQEQERERQSAWTALLGWLAAGAGAARSAFQQERQRCYLVSNGKRIRSGIASRWQRWQGIKVQSRYWQYASAADCLRWHTVSYRPSPALSIAERKPRQEREWSNDRYASASGAWRYRAGAERHKVQGGAGSASSAFVYVWSGAAIKRSVYGARLHGSWTAADLARPSKRTETIYSREQEQREYYDHSLRAATGVDTRKGYRRERSGAGYSIAGKDAGIVRAAARARQREQRQEREQRQRQQERQQREQRERQQRERQRLAEYRQQEQERGRLAE